MQQVIQYIDERASAMGSHPLLEWLADESIPPGDRLSSWLPCAAFFVFSFMDLNAEVLGYPEAEAAVDPLKQAINHHLAEDAMHWPWYLSDLQKLGMDETMKFSEALRLLWGKETVAQRRAMYRMCLLAGQAEDPILRYSLIAALESVAHLLFAELVKVSDVYTTETGIQLVYLGPIHFEREPGHMANQQDDTEELLFTKDLDEATRRKAIEIAAEVCDAIDARWHEMLRYAQAHVCAGATVA